MYAPQVNIALRAARRAGEFLRRHVDDARHIAVEQKGHNDFVTQVDRACEALIIDTLQRSYPDHSFLAEESGLVEGKGDDARWQRSEEHTSELQSRGHLVCRLLLEKNKHAQK